MQTIWYQWKYVYQMFMLHSIATRLYDFRDLLHKSTALLLFVSCSIFQMKIAEFHECGWAPLWAANHHYSKTQQNYYYYYFLSFVPTRLTYSNYTCFIRWKKLNCVWTSTIHFTCITGYANQVISVLLDAENTANISSNNNMHAKMSAIIYQEYMYIFSANDIQFSVVQ